MKKLLVIIVLGLLLNTNAQAKHRTFDDPFYHWNRFEAKGSENHYKFQSNLREDKDVLKEIKNTKKTGLISYLLFEDDKIVIDESDIPDKTRKGKNNEAEKIHNGLLQSHSMGKSLVSYVTGHAICEGYISSVDEKLTGWDVIENTLYDNQVLIDLLNMQAGDQRYVGEKIKPHEDSTLKNKKWGGRKINVNTVGLKRLMKKYFQNTEKSQPVYNYSALTTNVIMNYVIFKTGDDWEKLLHKVFNEHVKVKDNVYFHQTVTYPYKGSGRYSFYATRYDYLRIAKTIMDDWNNNTCAGKYLKTIYERRINKNRKESSYEPKSAGSYSRKYGGQFHFDITGLSKRKILAMDGFGGQQILIDFDIKRIIVVNTMDMHYNWRKIVYKKIKEKKLKLGKSKEKTKVIKYVATAKNKKDNLVQMKSRKYSSIYEAENDVLKRCKLFFEPYGNNMQEACYIYSIDKE